MHWLCTRCLLPVACVLGSTIPARAQVQVASDPLTFLNRGLRSGVAAPGQAPQRWSLNERMRHYGVPGVAIAVFRNGEVAQAVG